MHTVLFAMVVKTRMYACTFALCNVQSSRQPTEQDRCCIRFKVVLDSKSDTTTTTKITTQRHYISHYAYDYPLLAHCCYYYHGKSENRPIKKRKNIHHASKAGKDYQFHRKLTRKFLTLSEGISKAWI